MLSEISCFVQTRIDSGDNDFGIGLFVVDDVVRSVHRIAMNRNSSVIGTHVSLRVIIRTIFVIRQEVVRISE